MRQGYQTSSAVRGKMSRSPSRAAFTTPDRTPTPTPARRFTWSGRAQFGRKVPPRLNFGPSAEALAVLGARQFNVASATQGHQVRQVVLVAAAVERNPMVTLQPARAAAPSAPPAVALEDLPPHRLPPRPAH